MTKTENQLLMAVYLDQSIENIRKLKEICARKGITSLKGCVIAATDFFVVNHNTNSELNQVKTTNGSNGR